MAGLYFEEFTEGQVVEHAVTRTVTEMDNVLFTTLTMNPQPLHLDAEFARTTEFGLPPRRANEDKTGVTLSSFRGAGQRRARNPFPETGVHGFRASPSAIPE